MKITIEKICRSVIDTAKERRRIGKAFDKDPTTREWLYKLMDAVENSQWQAAAAIIENKWMQGYDDGRGCLRCEFVGLLFARSTTRSTNVPPAFDNQASYIDLVWKMLNRPKYYRVAKKSLTMH